VEGERLWKKKDRLPSLSGRGDRAHQENTKEVSLKEGERKRRERCKSYFPARWAYDEEGL